MKVKVNVSLWSLSEKMVKSMEAPACARLPARGGYTIHPVSAPLQLLMIKVREEMMEGEVKNLCCLFEGKLCLGHQLLMVPVSFQIPRL